MAINIADELFEIAHSSTFENANIIILLARKDIIPKEQESKLWNNSTIFAEKSQTFRNFLITNHSALRSNRNC